VAETLRTKEALSCFLPGLETSAWLRKAATPRHFRHQPGKSPFGGTAWWSRQDSNLQPDRMQGSLKFRRRSYCRHDGGCRRPPEGPRGTRGSARSAAEDDRVYPAAYRISRRNARDRDFTEAKMKQRLEQIDGNIARYLSAARYR
jgi:hypothetical protein